MDFCARVQTEAGRRFRKTRLCERFLRRGEEIYWGSRVVVRGPGRVSFDTILLYLHIYTLQPNAFQNRFLDDFITSSVVSAPPRRKLFFDALHIYIYRERERERLPRLLRASLILLSSSSSSSFHRSRARRFVDGLRRAPIVVVWYFNPKVFDDCIDFPFEFFRALNLALIASLLLSAFQRG